MELYSSLNLNCIHLTLALETIHLFFVYFYSMGIDEVKKHKWYSALL